MRMYTGHDNVRLIYCSFERRPPNSSIIGQRGCLWRARGVVLQAELHKQRPRQQRELFSCMSLKSSTGAVLSTLFCWWQIAVHAVNMLAIAGGDSGKQLSNSTIRQHMEIPALSTKEIFVDGKMTLEQWVRLYLIRLRFAKNVTDSVLITQWLIQDLWRLVHTNAPSLHVVVYRLSISRFVTLLSKHTITVIVKRNIFSDIVS